MHSIFALTDEHRGAMIVSNDRGCAIYQYHFGCDSHRRRDGKGESAERGDVLKVKSWAYG